ncbi:hypothetical protein Tco_1221168 [Tanacetum coccineum]
MPFSTTNYPSDICKVSANHGFKNLHERSPYLDVSEKTFIYLYRVIGMISYGFSNLDRLYRNFEVSLASFSINNLKSNSWRRRTTEQSRLGHPFCKEILKGGIGPYATMLFVHDEVRPEISRKHTLCQVNSFQSTYGEIRLHPHQSSNGRSPVGAIKIGASREQLRVFTWTWDVFVVRVGHFLSNPSPWFALYTISPLKGTSGLSVCARERVIGAGFDRVKEITFPPLTVSKGTEGPLVIEVEIGGHAVHRMYVDGGSSMEVLFEHCFNWLRPEIKSQMVPAITSLTGFSGETIWPLGHLRLLVMIGDAEHSTKAWMNFMIVRSPSPYNGIIGWPGIREIQAVPSTAYGMIKFLVNDGIVTIHSTILTPTKCAAISATPKDTENKAETRHENFKVAIHPDFSDQEIAIGGPLSAKGTIKLCALLKANLNIFAWQPSDMTGVPRLIVEHRLNIRDGYPPVRQKTRSHSPERAKAIQAEVQKLVEAWIMHEVYYHDWLSNPVIVKKHDSSCRMCADFTDLNKACPQDCYPLPEIDWKVESLCGYPFKCFLDAYKGYH